MGKLTTIVIAVILTFTVIGFLSAFFYNNSNDALKTEFKNYSTEEAHTYGDPDSILSSGNQTYQDNGNPVSAFAWVSNQIQTSISQTTTQLNNTDTSVTGVLNKIAAGFGLLATLVIGIAVITLFLPIELLGLVGGILSNLNDLPGDWKLLAGLTVTIMVIGLSYTVFVLYRSVKLGDNI